MLVTLCRCVIASAQLVFLAAAAVAHEPPLSLYASASGRQLLVRSDYTVVSRSTAPSPYRDRQGRLLKGRVVESDLYSWLADCSVGQVKCAVLYNFPLVVNKDAFAAEEVYTFIGYRFTPLCIEFSAQPRRCLSGIVRFEGMSDARDAGFFVYEAGGVVAFARRLGVKLDPSDAGMFDSVWTFGWGLPVLGPGWGTDDSRLRPPKFRPSDGDEGGSVPQSHANP